MTDQTEEMVARLLSNTEDGQNKILTHHLSEHVAIQGTEEDIRKMISGRDRAMPVFVREGYDSLFTILCKALHQAQDGKGKERHDNGEAFLDQPIMGIAHLVGMGFQTGQAIKKTVEAHGMVNRGDLAAAEREILGAINYLAAAALRVNQIATDQMKEN